jgi:hypothetical protein
MGMLHVDDVPVEYYHPYGTLPYIVRDGETISWFEIPKRYPLLGNVRFRIVDDHESKKVRFRHHPLRFAVIESLLRAKRDGILKELQPGKHIHCYANLLGKHNINLEIWGDSSKILGSPCLCMLSCLSIDNDCFNVRTETEKSIVTRREAFLLAWEKESVDTMGLFAEVMADDIIDLKIPFAFLDMPEVLFTFTPRYMEGDKKYTRLFVGNKEGGNTR